MKKLSILLAFSLFASSIAYSAPTMAPEKVEKIETQFYAFKRELNAYIKCLKRDKNCDKKKLKQLKIAAISLIGIVAAGPSY